MLSGTGLRACVYYYLYTLPAIYPGESRDPHPRCLCEDIKGRSNPRPNEAISPICFHFYSSNGIIGIDFGLTLSYGRQAGRPNIGVSIPAFAGMGFPSLFRRELTAVGRRLSFRRNTSVDWLQTTRVEINSGGKQAFLLP